MFVISSNSLRPPAGMKDGERCLRTGDFFKRCFLRDLRDNKKIICWCVCQLTRLLIIQMRQFCLQEINLFFFLVPKTNTNRYKSKEVFFQ
jgi:hypothetical protein